MLKLSITLFLLGYAISQFFWGSLSERLGRKRPILWGLALACIGSLIAMLSPDVMVFNSARLIEGLGIGSAVVLGRAVFTDSFNRGELSRVAAYMVALVNFIPAVAPLLGGYLLLWLGWRSIFGFLILYTIAIFILFYRRIGETHQQIRTGFTFRQALSQYLHVVAKREFLWYLFPYALLGGGLTGYYAATPYIFVSVLEILPHIYPYYSLVTVAAYIAGAALTTLLTRRLGFDKPILIGILIALTSGIVLLFLWIFAQMGVWSVVLPMALYSFGVSMMTPNANAGAMASSAKTAGAAAAMLGAVISGAGALLAYILNELDLASLSSLAFYVIVLCLLVLLLYLLVRPRQTARPNLREGSSAE